LERVERPAVAVRVPVKLAAELMVWPLINPEVMRPVVRLVEKRLVEDAVVAKKFVVVAEVPVAVVKVKFCNVEELVARRSAAVKVPLNVSFEPRAVVYERDVVVALVVVELIPVKFWRVVDPVARIVLKVLAPVKALLSASKVVEATTILAVPSKEIPLIVRAVCNFVAVPALPEMEPVMVLVKVLFPVKALLSARRVEEAAVRVEQPNWPEPLKVKAFEAVLHVERPAPKKFVVDAVVVKRLVEVALVVVELPKVVPPVKLFMPLNPLLSPSRVVEATTILAVPSNETPLIVRAVWSLVAVPALPETEPWIVLATKRLVVVAEVVVERPKVTPFTKVVEAAVQILEFPRLREARTTPVVGEMVRVPPPLSETEVTEPEPVPQALPMEKTLPVASTWRQPAPVETKRLAAEAVVAKKLVVVAEVLVLFI
jgi:hypothetical protein